MGLAPSGSWRRDVDIALLTNWRGGVDLVPSSSVGLAASWSYRQGVGLAPFRNWRRTWALLSPGVERRCRPSPLLELEGSRGLIALLELERRRGLGPLQELESRRELSFHQEWDRRSGLGTSWSWRGSVGWPPPIAEEKAWL